MANTTQDKLMYLAETKKQVMSALKAMGVDVPANATFRDTVGLIKRIEGGAVKLFDSVDKMMEAVGTEGNIALVYDVKTEIFTGIYWCTGKTWEILNTQVNVTADKIAPGVIGYGPDGIVEGTFTSDATATPNDMLASTTAYVNGEKITGKIIPTYIKSNLNISKEQLPVKANKNYVWDYSLENNLVISSNGYVGTTTITLNNENNIRDINISDIGSTYVNIQAAKFYQKADNNIQKILLIVNDNDNGYLVILKINIITLEIISVYVNTSKIMSGVQTYGSFGYKILIHPTMENTVTVSVKNKEKYGYGIHVNIYTFRIIDTTFTQLNTFKISRGANIYGHQENNFVDMVWSPNGTNLLVIFSAREYKQFPKFVYIVYFSSNLTTATVVDTGLTENAPNCFLNDKYFIKGNNIYNYENKTITLYKTLTEFTSTSIANYIAVLNEYYLIHFVKDSNIINIYSFDEDLNFTFVKSYNWNITLSSVAVCGNTLVFANYYSLDRILYSENNIIQTIYTGSGASNEYEKINIIGIDYFNTSESIVTSDKVLKDEKVFTSDGKIIGTMPNNGTLNYIPSTEEQIIPAGYTSGGTIVGDANLLPENIKSGVTIFGVTGTYTGETITEATNDEL